MARARININVRLFGHLRRFRPSHATDSTWLTVSATEGVTVAEALRELGVPEDVPRLASVNGSLVEGDHVLKAADELLVAPPASGGSVIRRARGATTTDRT